MKTLTKTLLATSLLLALPLGAYAASEAAATAATTTQNAAACPAGGPMMNGKMRGGHHKMRAPLTAEQMKAHLQQRYDNLPDAQQKAQFIKDLTTRADNMVQRADEMKTFAKAHQ